MADNEACVFQINSRAISIVKKKGPRAGMGLKLVLKGRNSETGSG
jgi:hypothetical protein